MAARRGTTDVTSLVSTLSKHRVGSAAVGAALVAAVAAACGPVFAGPPLATGQITRDANDSFAVANRTGNTRWITPSNPGTASMFGFPRNVGENSRFVFFDGTQATSQDQQSCTTVASDSNAVDQEGLALRITTARDGTGRAVVFAKNVYLGVTADFNVYGMSGGAATPFVELASHDYRNLEPSGVQIHLPFAMCARVVGNVFTGVVWHPEQMSQPAWNDPRFVFSFTLPPEWVGSGYAGYYFGHLGPDDIVTYTNMRSLPATFG